MSHLKAVLVCTATATVALAACGSNTATSAPASSGATARHFTLGPAATRTPGPRQTPAVKGSLPPSTLSAADIQATLDAHNAWRTKEGEALLTWDSDLAALAQDWSTQMAQSGTFDHRPNNNEGENIVSGTGTYAPKDVVDAWGSEVSSYHRDTNTCDANQQCGHYTQLVWASTTKVGCGVATGGDGTVYWTCNYDPPGNSTGISPFDAAAQKAAAQ